MHVVFALILSAISILINDVKLPLDPPARFYHGRLYVPVRHTIEALGLQFNRSPHMIWTEIGSKTVELTSGTRGLVEIKDVLYAPLRFFTDVLGAQASYNSKSNRVTIVAQLMGTAGNGIIEHGKSVQRYGTVSAIDVNSDPPTVTLTYNATVRTVPIAANAQIDLHDVNANVSMAGELTDVRPGDFARLYYDQRGHVVRVRDEFGSYSGRVAAATGGVFVLDDGHVITPTRTTQVTLNGRTAQFGDVRVGDRADIRYNVETNETRSVSISREVVPTPGASPAAVSISRIDVQPGRALHAGDTVWVYLHGTPGGSATFDIGSYVSTIAMTEKEPGTYVGSYHFSKTANFAETPVIGHLRVGGVDAPDEDSTSMVSLASAPPGIADFAPAEGAWVNTKSPVVYVTFAADAVPVNPSSVQLWVNGREVTSECIRTEEYVQYFPRYRLAAGPVKVSVRVADRAGNVTTKSWSFNIRK